MILLRSNMPTGIHVWRDQPDGHIVEAAAVWDTGFEWRGLEGRMPPADFAELSTRPGREYFFVHDSEKTEWGGLPGGAILDALVSAEAMDLDRDDARGLNPAWNDPTIFPAKEAARVATYRRHQSWYRENVLQAEPGAFMRYEALLT